MIERETNGILAGHYADGQGHSVPAETCRCTGLEATLNRLAFNGNLPFIAKVQVWDTEGWTDEASGSSVRWLLGAADEAAEFFGRVRIVAPWGDVLA